MYGDFSNSEKSNDLATPFEINALKMLVVVVSCVPCVGWCCWAVVKYSVWAILLFQGPAVRVVQCYVRHFDFDIKFFPRGGGGGSLYIASAHVENVQ